jgi:thiosulfate dehydrogenase (quinone) large subunit
MVTIDAETRSTDSTSPQAGVDTAPGKAGERVYLSRRRMEAVAALRIAFGVIWGVDAWFKWQPSFISGFSDYLTGARDGQPGIVKGWIGFWIDIVKVDPHVFAHLVAIGETAVAIGLIFGLFSNLTYATGSALAFVIWSTAEGFGGPYKAGSTDIGAAVIYVLVFAGLYLVYAGRFYGLDKRLGDRLGRWAWLASGKTPADES